METRRAIALVLELGGLALAVALGGVGGLIAILAAVSVARWVRGGRWFVARDGDGAAGWSALGGAAVGAGALAAAWMLSPAVAGLADASVEWTTEPVVRGSWSLALTVAAVTLALGVAGELVFRRWLVDRVAGWVQARGAVRTAALVVGVLAASAIEAAVSARGGEPVGTFVAGVGVGTLYVGAGGRLAPCLSARLVFDLGAILLQALRVTP